MFTLYGKGRQKTCEGYTRRELLQVGTLGIGGLTLSSLLSASANAASGKPLLKDKAIVLLNLQGGASHIETFDPKMTAPAEYRAMFGEVKTKLPGVTFGRLNFWVLRCHTWHYDPKISPDGMKVAEQRFCRRLFDFQEPPDFLAVFVRVYP